MDIETYKEILTSIIKKQSSVLGMSVAVDIAKKRSDITLSDKGIVTEIEGEPKKAMEGLVSSYMALSGQISSNALGGRH